VINCTSCYICLVIVVKLFCKFYAVSSDLHLPSSASSHCYVETSLMGPAVCAKHSAFAAKLAVTPHSITYVEATLGIHQPLHGLKPQHPHQPQLPIGCLLETWAR
jgi:hypothetical protein